MHGGGGGADVVKETETLCAPACPTAFPSATSVSLITGSGRSADGDRGYCSPYWAADRVAGYVSATNTVLS